MGRSCSYSGIALGRLITSFEFVSPRNAGLSRPRTPFLDFDALLALAWAANLQQRTPLPHLRPADVLGRLCSWILILLFKINNLPRHDLIDLFLDVYILFIASPMTSVRITGLKNR